jgi:hypothetical protein
MILQVYHICLLLDQQHCTCHQRLVVGGGLMMSYRVIVGVSFIKDKAIGIVLGTERVSREMLFSTEPALKCVS